jgi:type II secretory pathway pseudopilin PulG
LSAGGNVTKANGSEAGFALLEGLVAIALLAGTMVAIFALIGGILDSASRVGRSNASVQITLNAMEVMAAVNPMTQESGKIDLGPYSVAWTSAPAAPMVDRSGSLYQIGLYDTRVRVEESSGEVLASFTMRQVGYRRVRDPISILGTPAASENLPPARR